MITDFLQSYPEAKVGILVAAVAAILGLKLLIGGGPSKESEQKKESKVALDAKEYKKFPLKEKFIVNHNTRIFRFGLPHPSDRLGLPIGQHISVRATVNGKEAYRPYTPISSDEDLGHFDLLIKVYDKGVMSGYIDKMFIGDLLEVRGPKGLFNYEPNMFKNIGMLAGGTGITPMYQVIKAILRNPADKTNISLVFGNIAEEDILLRKELDELAAAHPEQFKLFYVLNTPPKGWSQGSGFITQEIIQTHLPAPADDTKVVLCGPPVMNKAMTGHLTQLNYPESAIFSF
ncbi:NADH-cytochrome b5 reductase [Heterostelium album PN500]|uniref:NADH-cytochrome b5 reductase n=1 Tax=Heterostelium pallidum (strain ATCC 26659 / Pp 5 / PN500) TaxID=670386 RepID=D3BR16_HETP5|nr:NADH-cytochrome b5 reductase [Heterostelium album PN500]EFA75848.1 NADH-cytochrome b5 reductase [Heterostelium album PN500]|eukprot:XP_020427982.1 NADH-cytochrome b5 reductase [Heterostelium album PN500]